VYTRGIPDIKKEIRVGKCTLLAVAALLVSGVTTLMGQSSSQPPDWRDWIKQGTEAFRWARYSEAASAFQKASDANPESPVPHLYLALGWLQQFIPGAMSADNADHARRAEAELRRALDLDPMIWTAAVVLGQLAFSESRLEDAREWYRKALAVEPRNAQTWCDLGVVAWQQCHRQGKLAHQPILEEAISDFEKSVAFDPANQDAMQYLSLLLRERADMREGDEEKRADLAAADRWKEKSADAAAEKVQAAIARTASGQSDTGDPDPLVRRWASMAVAPPPPLPPPPPPPARGRGGPASAASVSHGVVSWEPTVRSADQAPPIRVAAAEQTQKLITKVHPEYAAGAPAEGPMRFVVVIGKDGHIVRQTLISGNPWLLQTAVEALRRWVYQPTLVNGRPVEVVTEVRLEFKQAGGR